MESTGTESTDIKSAGMGSTDMESADMESAKMKLGEEFVGEINQLEGVTLTVETVSASSTGITYMIENRSEKDLNYGQDYGLHKKVDGKWYILEAKEPIVITLELLWVPAGSTDTQEIYWEFSYGKLSAGHYRLIKPVADDEQGYYLAGEFTVQ